nr:type I-E CRISPR-associated protein Cse2/CasB [Candidatus Sigynarchaeota archaeon]
MTLETAKAKRWQAREVPVDATSFANSLKKASRGDLTQLKRAAGGTIATSGNAMTTFYALFKKSKIWAPYKEDAYFLAATLFPLNPIPGHGNFGKTMRRIALLDAGGKKAADALKARARKLSALLDSRLKGGELAFRLRQCVKLAASKKVGIDWARLIDDLLHWDLPSRSVQRAWARSYYLVEGTMSQQGEPGKVDIESENEE